MSSRGESSARKSASGDPSITIGDYKRLNEIGKGSFAMVYRGVHASSGALVAIKSVNLAKLSRKLKENLQSEVKILRELHHPHIVSLFDCRETKSTAHLVMEFCELGDLSTFIRKRVTLGDHEITKDMIRKYPNPQVGGLNEVVSRHFLKQIASGLQWITKRHFLHRDIKPQNLLLVPSKSWVQKHISERQPLMADEEVSEPPAGIDSLPMLKIADFGFARFLPSLQLAETLCGSPLYMAPEILRYEKYDAKADLWSTGTVLYEMIVGKPPFRAQNHVELIAKIDKNDDRIRFPEGCAVSSNMKNIVRALLKRNPADRISYEKFFEHVVVTEDIPNLAPEDKPGELAYNLASRIKSTRPSEVLGESSRSDKSPVVSPRIRAISNAEPVPPRSLDRRGSDRISERIRRPSLGGPAATAPVKGNSQERIPTISALGRQQSSPQTATRDAIEQQRERERERRRSTDKALSDIREKAEQDIAFERDVVFVEKRAVEVNALADEFNNTPEVRGYQNAVARRTPSVSSPYSTTAPQTSTRPWPTPKQLPAHTRQRSLDKHLFGRSPSSASSAISKALHMASFRVLGIGGNSPPNKPIIPASYNPYPSYPSNQGSSLLISDGTRGVDQKDEDMRIALHVEKLAQRSSVIFDFAEVKYQQLIPIRPIDAPGSNPEGTKAVELEDDDDLTVDAIVTVAEEALVLYVHTLGILHKIFDLTASWLYQKKRTADDPSPRSAPVRSSSSLVPKINGMVQWARSRFNECIEKSEFVARKLVEAQRRLPADHPGHPSNHGTASSSLASNVGASSASNITLTSGVTAEKLMYDRAVEMSRAAAIGELTNEDLEGGERSYRTAIHMLEAVLNSGEGDISDIVGMRASEREGDEISGLEGEDKATVENLLKHLRTRLRSLRKKIDFQKTQARRLSSGHPQQGYPIPGAGASGTNRSSPSGTPMSTQRASPR